MSAKQQIAHVVESLPESASLAEATASIAARAGTATEPSWQAWFDFCKSFPAASDVRSYRDLLEEPYDR